MNKPPSIELLSVRKCQHRVINPRAHAQRWVIVVGQFVYRSVGLLVSLSVPTFSLEPWLL